MQVAAADAEGKLSSLHELADARHRVGDVDRISEILHPGNGRRPNFTGARIARPARTTKMLRTRRLSRDPHLTEASVGGLHAEIDEGGRRVAGPRRGQVELDPNSPWKPSSIPSADSIPRRAGADGRGSGCRAGCLVQRGRSLGWVVTSWPRV